MADQPYGSMEAAFHLKARQESGAATSGDLLLRSTEMACDNHKSLHQREPSLRSTRTASKVGRTLLAWARLRRSPQIGNPPSPRPIYASDFTMARSYGEQIANRDDIGAFKSPLVQTWSYTSAEPPPPRDSSLSTAWPRHSVSLSRRDSARIPMDTMTREYEKDDVFEVSVTHQVSPVVTSYRMRPFKMDTVDDFPVSTSRHTPFGFSRALRNRLKCSALCSGGKYDINVYIPIFIHDTLMLPGSLANLLGKMSSEELIHRMTPAILYGAHAWIDPTTQLPSVLRSDVRGDQVRGMVIFGQGRTARRAILDHFRRYPRSSTSVDSIPSTPATPATPGTIHTINDAAPRVLRPRRTKVDVEVQVFEDILQDGGCGWRDGGDADSGGQGRSRVVGYCTARRTIPAYAWLGPDRGEGELKYATETCREWTLDDYIAGQFSPVGPMRVSNNVGERNYWDDNDNEQDSRYVAARFADTMTLGYDQKYQGVTSDVEDAWQPDAYDPAWVE